ncbi:periplasmic binding protein/LacI transcriptional regulator [Candidatus Vecturithrix granuli]|uniref:Periplasmic binding protein/LacI transcriptional regulator n=1 Tax=Vecturithrix granuli TaxID=1499967 RepID=A0A081BZ11_VECG1|nr:periplasmic binding protein/LacI transcriptional regulator [Candidatus Vecturithrix granuli]
MKQFGVLIIVMSVLLSATAIFAQDLFEIAVSFPGSVEFFSVQKKGMDQAAEEFGVKLTYGDAEWDAGKQLSQVENFVAKGIDLLLLCTVDNQALIPAVDICKEAGVPLMTFTNALGPNPDGQFEGVLSFIGVNEVELGRLLGRMAEKILDNKDANIVLIEGTPGTPPQRMRTQGFKEIVDAHSNWKIVYSQAIPGWTKEGSLAAMEAFLQTGQTVDLVATHWHAAATAAATALEEANYEGDVGIIGLEFTKELIPIIKEGKVDMTTDYSISESGYKAVETAVKYLKGEQVPSFVEITPIIIDQKNVDEHEPEL